MDCSKVMEAGEKVHLQGMAVPRNKQRFRFLVQSIVMNRVIDTVFDYEPTYENDNDRANFHKKAWEWEDILKVEKHLFSKTEDAVFAFGLLSHQYEDPIQYTVIDAISKHLFSNRHDAHQQVQPKIDEMINPTIHLEAVTSSNHQQKPRDSEIVRDLYYFRKSLASNGLNNAKPEQETIMYIAHLLQAKMNPKPQLSDICSVMTTLLSTHIQTAYGHSIPAFVIEGKDICISHSLLDNNRPDRLKDTIKQVLTYKGCMTADYLYGEMTEQTPFLWQVIHIDEQISGKALKINEPGYCAPDLGQFLMQSKDQTGSSPFPQQHCFFVSEPLDNVGEFGHMDRIILNPQEYEEKPPTNASAYRKYSMCEEDRPNYPSQFMQSNVSRYQKMLRDKERDSETLSFKNTRRKRARFSYEQTLPTIEEDNNNDDLFSECSDMDNLSSSSSAAQRLSQTIEYLNLNVLNNTSSY